MEWEPAIEQLTALITSDENYADGLAKQLLYEAHVAEEITISGSVFTWMRVKSLKRPKTWFGIPTI
jgi:hypothetical protein